MSFFSRRKKKKEESENMVDVINNSAVDKEQAVEQKEPENEDAVQETDYKDHLYRVISRQIDNFSKNDIQSLGFPTALEAEAKIYSLIDWKSNEKVYVEQPTKSEEEQKPDGEQQEEAQPQEELPKEKVQVPPENAKVQIGCSRDSMNAYICVFPPLYGGEHITMDTLLEEIASKRISYGLDSEMLQRIVDEQLYMTIYRIALGKEAVDGVDGEITEYYDRERSIKLIENESGRVDLKDLNIFHSIKQGQIICVMTPPVPPESGMDVRGKIFPGRKGKDAIMPQGDNTVLSEDGLQLLAGMDGDISFKNNKFVVSNLLVIEQNVNNSVGNLDFGGDILIKGDVCAGFTVKATGNVIVKGMVESAVIYAGESVQIDKGMNGSGKGLLEVGGDVKCRFLENALIRAKGDIFADTIINCNIITEGSLHAVRGKGIVVGGDISVGTMVEAIRIGNQSGMETVIRLGYARRAGGDITKIDTEFRTAKDTLETVKKNINYLSQIEELPREKQVILNELLKQKGLYENMCKGLEQKIVDSKKQSIDYSDCYVRAEQAFPVIRVYIEHDVYYIKDLTRKCKVYYQDGEFVMGTF